MLPSRRFASIAMTDRDPASFTPKDIAIAMTALAPFVSIPEADDAVAVAVAIIVPVAVSDADVDTMLAGLKADLRGGGHGQREQRSTRQDENQLSHSNLLQVLLHSQNSRDCFRFAVEISTPGRNRIGMKSLSSYLAANFPRRCRATESPRSPKPFHE
jgi:hypothetical protein